MSSLSDWLRSSSTDILVMMQLTAHTSTVSGLWLVLRSSVTSPGCDMTRVQLR